MCCQTNKTGILLSCIIPFYNSLPHLGELTSSLFMANCGWVEFIFVNDASTDKGEVFLADLIRRHDVHNASVLSLEENRGPSAARNAGLEIARGKYIWCIDSDDLVVPSSWHQIFLLIYEETLDVLIIGFEFASVQTRRNLVYTTQTRPDGTEALDVRFVEERTIQTHPPDTRTLVPGKVMGREDGVIADMFRDKAIYTWLFIVRSDLYQDIRFPEGKLLEDVCTLPKLFFKAKRFYFLDTPVILYRRHRSSLLGRGGKTLYTSLCETIPLLKEYIVESSVQLTYHEWLELNSFHLQTLVWAANNYFLSNLTADGVAMDILARSLREYKATTAQTPSAFKDNLRSLQRPVDRYVARIITMSLPLYFTLRRFLTYVRPVRNLVSRVLSQ